MVEIVDIEDNLSVYQFSMLLHGSKLKKNNIAKYVSKFLIYGAKMLDKCVESEKIFFVHCPFLQSQAK